MTYVGKIYLGATEKEFDCVYDTGSAWLWVPSQECTSCNKFAKHYYDCHSTSGDCEPYNTRNLDYGKGSAIAFEAKDEITFGGNLTYPKQTFLVVSSAKDFDGMTADGIYGLGFKIMSSNIPTFMDNFKDANLIKERKFSMYLSYYQKEILPLSELIIDGYDEKYMIENFTHVPVVSS